MELEALASTRDAAADLLWWDPGPFRRRAERSALGLLALARRMESRGATDRLEREFLESAVSLAALPEPIRTTLWRDHYACFWVRTAEDLLDRKDGDRALRGFASAYAREMGALGVAEAFARPLQEFKRVLLGAALLSGRDCRFETPLRLHLPLAIPGTKWGLFGADDIVSSGVRDGALVLYRHTQRFRLPVPPPHHRSGSEGAVLRECPTIGAGGCEIRLQPFPFRLAGPDGAATAAWDPVATRTFDGAHVAEALGLIERHQPETFAQIRDGIEVVAFRPRGGGLASTDVVPAELPGAAFVHINHNPHVVAASLVGELHRDRLLAVEEGGALLREGEADGGANDGSPRLLSPWPEIGASARDLLRGLHGIVPTTRFWLSVFAADEADPDTMSFAIDRVVRGRIEVAVAARQIERHACFTDCGARLYRAMRSECAALLAEIDESDVPDESVAVACSEDGTILPIFAPGARHPCSGREAVIEHLRRTGSATEVEEALR